MNEEDKNFIKRYEELLDKGYCDCNEMNCIDNNSPRRILNIVKDLQSKIDKAIEYITSYESISTIQGIDNIEENKKLDENTINKMTNRYLIVHHKLLDILEEDKK